ncbi:hypothetical protein EDD29_4258 [Actinocorallia herbida]|uniref:DUF1963 domain-containing protein n=1 Tax=Actinocorallia herbida TaxID=58109 RepID=A0A3N1CZH3_9ACTN|nr:hypothetical protein [Actinocorallia herbida]ROO86681.1 hypothetical protein EDD29_4258 [Actinocorallia herbida]
MRFVSPPRNLNVAALFPGIERFAREAVRLHPRAGAPGTGESSVGGPLLWPSDEEWPTCSEPHAEYALFCLAEARERRTILAQVKTQGHAPTGALRARMYELLSREFPLSSVEAPVPMLPVAQLYARDVPGLPCPEGADLLQVLWCPLDHESLPYTAYGPDVRLRWRESGAVADPLAVYPEPRVIAEPYLVSPCAVYPETVVEYPYPQQLPVPLERAIEAWETEVDGDYAFVLALRKGVKVGGWGDWSLTDHFEIVCPECGSRMDENLLLTLGGTEGDSDDRWLVERDRGAHHADDVGFTIGDDYALYVYPCPASFDHAPAIVIQ